VTDLTLCCDDAHKFLILIVLHYCSTSNADVNWWATNVAPHLLWVGIWRSVPPLFVASLLKAVRKNPDSGCFSGSWGVPREVLRLPS